MRKFLLRLLAFVVLLQLSWAAAASVCAHEKDPAAHHFGHHVHVHAGAHSGGVDSQGDRSPVPDGDCAVCHFTCGSFVVSVSVWNAPFAHVQPAAPPPSNIPIPPLDGPERPRWFAAA